MPSQNKQIEDLVTKWYDELPKRMYKPATGQRLLTVSLHELVQFIESYAAAEREEGRVEGIKMVDAAILDDITGSYPVAALRNLIKLLVWENTPTEKRQQLQERITQ